MGVIYSKKRLVAQQNGNKSLKYMEPLAPGTVVTINDIVRDSYTTKDGEVINDTLMCTTNEGVSVKFPVKEFNKMTLEGEAYEGEAGTDAIELPDAFTIISSEDRKFTPQGSDVEQTLFPTFSYKDGRKFVESKGDMEWTKMLEGGLLSPNPYKAVQNYTAKVVS